MLDESMQASDFVDLLSKEQNCLDRIIREPSCISGQANVKEENNQKVYTITNCSGKTVYFYNPGEKNFVTSFENFVNWFNSQMVFDDNWKPWFEREASNMHGNEDILDQLEKCFQTADRTMFQEGSVRISGLVHALVHYDCGLALFTRSERCPAFAPPLVATFENDKRIQFNIRTREESTVGLATEDVRYRFRNCHNKVRERVGDLDVRPLLKIVVSNGKSDIRNFLHWFLYDEGSFLGAEVPS